MTELLFFTLLIMIANISFTNKISKDLPAGGTRFAICEQLVSGIQVYSVSGIPTKSRDFIFKLFK